MIVQDLLRTMTLTNMHLNWSCIASSGMPLKALQLCIFHITKFQSTGFAYHTYIELFHDTPGVIH